MLQSMGSQRVGPSNWTEIRSSPQRITDVNHSEESRKKLRLMGNVPDLIPENGLYTVDVCLVTQSCLTLCNPMDCSPLGSSVCGILQAPRSMRLPMANSGLPCPPPGDLPDPGMEPHPLYYSILDCWGAREVTHALCHVLGTRDARPEALVQPLQVNSPQMNT